MQNKTIKGAGGGKGSSSGTRAASEAPDNLRSIAYARVIDLVSEGPIEGLVNGGASIFLDGTPIVDSQGRFNFKNFQTSFFNGYPNQRASISAPFVQSEKTVGVEVTAGVPVSRTITTDIDAVRVRVSCPSLTTQDPATGSLTGAAVEYRIEISYDGSPYVTLKQDTIAGKSTSKYERSFYLKVTPNAGPYSLRVTRLTADSSTVLTQNRLFFESYTEVIEAKLAYPYSAIGSIRIDSEQFSNIPVRGYHCRGLHVKVPVNYDVVTRQYNGVWDGRFNVSYTNNPAWVMYDLLTNERYGLGAFISESKVDKWSFYEIAKYCDEMVSNGSGGFEPRFTCNVYLQTRTEAYRLLQDLASCFRGMAYWSGGAITVSQDAPKDAAHLFTPANVVDGKFVYSGSSLKQRHSVALVAWNDPDDLFRQKVEYVEDQEAVARYGIIETEVVAFGCTSRGQANRAGKWLLYSEQYQTETVQFSTGVTGAICRPGQIIKISDPVRAGIRLGGRVVSASTNSITVDQTLSLPAGNYTLTIVRPDGTVENKNAGITSGSNVISVAQGFGQTPQAQSVWMLASNDIQSQTFRIISVTEAANGIYAITALSHDERKFNAVENNIKLAPRDISQLSFVPAAPSNLQIKETLYEVNGEVRVKVTVSWDPVFQASSYIVEYQVDGNNPVTVSDITVNDYEILNAEPGVYAISVYALSPLNKKSTPSTTSKRIIGKAIPPAAVSGFSLMPFGDQAYLTWDKSVDLDVLIGGSVRIRYAPVLTGAVWKDSVDIGPALPGSARNAQVPLLEGTYLAKFVDSSGNSSMTATSIVTTAPRAYAINIVRDIVESPDFGGTKDNMAYFPDIGGVAGLALTGGLVDDIPDIDSVPSWDFGDGVLSEGSYTFEDTVDLGGAYTSRLTCSIGVRARDIADNIDSRTTNVDDWLDIDGDNIDDVNATLYMRTTTDNPSGSPTWTEWKPFFVGLYLARGFQFKLVCTSGSVYHNIAITDLSVQIDLPDRDEKFQGLTSGASVYSVTYVNAFQDKPVVSVTAYDMNSGDKYDITNETRSGFDIVFKNSGGTAVSRKFDVLARGFGRQVI